MGLMKRQDEGREHGRCEEDETGRDRRWCVRGNEVDKRWERRWKMCEKVKTKKEGTKQEEMVEK